MASRRIEDLHPTLREVFEFGLIEWNKRFPALPYPFLTATYRDNKEQEELYAQGRTKKGARLTNARSGQSPHNYLPSFAFDIAFKTTKGELDWNKTLFALFASIVKEKHEDVITWGGDFQRLKDSPHFELKGWKENRP